MSLHKIAVPLEGLHLRRRLRLKAMADGCRCYYVPYIMLTAPPSTLPPLSIDGNIIAAFVERAVSRRSGEQLTAAQRERSAAVRAMAETFGAYVIEAADAEEVRARVDLILEDPAYYQSLVDFIAKMSLSHDELVEALGGSPQIDDFYDSPFARVLGPAAQGPLRALRQDMSAWATCLIEVHNLLPAGAIEESLKVVCSMEPLKFLSDPSVPVPAARALLASLRTTVYTYAAGAAVFRGYVDGWLGTTLAEEWESEAREYVKFMRDIVIPKLKGSTSSNPGEKPKYLELDEQGAAVSAAYRRFNSAAERSGEQVFPPTA